MMTGAKQELVSIVLPTYQRRRYLEAAVDSVLAQTHEGWELLIVDDGSTDGTSEYLATIGDPRVRVLSLAHRGVVSAVRNAGIRESRARFVAFLDSDDAWLPSKLERQLAAMQHHPSCAWSFHACRHIDAEGGAIPPSRFEPWRPQSGYVFEALLAHRLTIACPSVMVQRSQLEAVGGFDESLSYSEDYDLWLRLAERCSAWAMTEVLASVRHHDAHNSYGNPAVNDAFVEVYDKVIRRSDDPRVLGIARRQRADYLRHAANRAILRGPGREVGPRLLRALRADPGAWKSWRLLGKAIVRRPRGPT